MEGKSYINFNEDRLPEVFEFQCGKHMAYYGWFGN